MYCKLHLLVLHVLWVFRTEFQSFNTEKYHLMFNCTYEEKEKKPISYSVSLIDINDKAYLF